MLFRCHAIIRILVVLMLIRPLGTNFSDIWFTIQNKFKIEHAFENAFSKTASILSSWLIWNVDMNFVFFRHTIAENYYSVFFLPRYNRQS